MIRYRAIKQIHFCAAHRLFQYQGPCSNIHGHNYLVEVFVEDDGLDKQGMVVDFKVIKSQIQNWIDEYWDHALIYYSGDEELDLLVKELLLGSGTKYFKLGSNPTAENMAEFLLDHVCTIQLAHFGVKATKIRLWETPNSYVDVSYGQKK